MVERRDGARTTAVDVRYLTGSDLEDPVLHAFINAASYKVDDIASAEPDAPEPLLEEIEMWLAAHLSTSREGELLDSETHDTYRADYSRETSYLETARSLDPSNVLSSPAAYIDFGTPDAKDIR